MGYHLTLDTLYSKKIEDIEFNHYDYIVIGAGAYGVSFVHKIMSNDPNSKILILEKGNFLLPEHFQNQKSCFLDTFNKSFASPWTTNSSEGLFYFGQRPYVGGRALFWNAWTPQPKEFRNWPKELVNDLQRYWCESQSFLGVEKLRNMKGINSELADSVIASITPFYKQHVNTSTNNEPGIPYHYTFDDLTLPEDLEGELAIKGDNDEWCRFSPVEPLVKLILKHPNNIDLITNCEVSNITTKDKAVQFLHTNIGDIFVNKATVIAANGVFEPFITLKSAFPKNDKMGKNLLGHFRSQLLIRTPKENSNSTKGNQLGAHYIPGKINGREFHIHLSCYSSDSMEKNYEYIYKRLPDPTFLPVCKDSKYNYYLLQGMAEYLGYLENSNVNNNFLELIIKDTPCDKTTIGTVNIDLTKDEHLVWDEMDEVMIQLANLLRTTCQKLEVFYQPNPFIVDGSWINPGDKLSKETSLDQDKSVKLSSAMKGKSMMHEGGVFWMGKEASDSVTDLYGRIHETDNLYVLGSAIFPTIGSYNPTLTGVALNFRLADKLSGK